MDILMGLIIALLAGLLPMLVYALMLWWFDRYEKEPLPLLAAAFLWGAIPSILMALIAEVVFDVPIQAFVSDGLAYELIGSSLVAPIIEEIVKGLAVLGVFVFFRREFDSVLDGVIYGSLVGFGFAAVENVLYFLSAYAEGGMGQMLGLVVVRAVLFGLNHALFTSMIGIGFALARLSRSCLVRVSAPLVGLILAISIHAIHNGGMTLAETSCCLPLVSLASDWGGVLVIFLVILLATSQEQSWLTTYLPEEVSLGVLSQAEYKVICSYLERVSQRMGAFFGGDFKRWQRLGRFYQTATELAFRKHQLKALGDEGGSQAAIERLRQQLSTMQR